MSDFAKYMARCAAILLVAAISWPAAADDALGPQPTWKPLPATDIREAVQQYLAGRSLDEAQLEQPAHGAQAGLDEAIGRRGRLA